MAAINGLMDQLLFSVDNSAAAVDEGREQRPAFNGTRMGPGGLTSIVDRYR